MINGVQIIPLKKIDDERGAVLHMLRKDAPHFRQFGEVYMSYVNYKKIKAWKRHKLQFQNLAVPFGLIKLVLSDSRDGSSTAGEIMAIEIGYENYNLVTIPPLVWYGFQGLSQPTSLIVNCADIPHDPAESERADIAENSPVQYLWN